MSVDRRAHVPLYAQLEAILRRQIGEGMLKPGDVVPTETELGQHYQVSRITVRAALDSLTKDGLLERQPGRGTFVTGTLVAPSQKHHEALRRELERWLESAERAGLERTQMRNRPAARSPKGNV